MGALAVGRVTAAELDAVTVDAHGTLVALVDPVPGLTAALAERGFHRDRDAVLHGFRAEVAHYTRHAARGRDEDGLVRLQRECASIFLEAVGADLDAEAFAPVYARAMRFEVLPGVVAALQRLRSLGLELAVVANWDLTLRHVLEEVGLADCFRCVIHAAAKPAPDGLLRALARLEVDGTRALHVGDDEADELAARAAGTHFAAAPLPEAVAALA
jgi:HAD superfamily hydrolase (TIGR01509 family)